MSAEGPKFLKKKKKVGQGTPVEMCALTQDICVSGKGNG